jgi:FkbM family methyltransferase
MKEKKLKSGYTFYWDDTLNADYSAIFKETNSHYKYYSPKEDDIILDVGANIGDMPLKWSNLCKHIYSYEPIKNTFDVMKYNIERNGIKNTTIYQSALGIGNDPIKLYINEKVKNGSISAGLVPKRGKQEQTINKIDFNSEMHRIKPNVVKIDIEGGEREILEGIDPTIYDYIDIFFIEFHPDLFPNDPEWEQREVKKISQYFNTSQKVFKYKLVASLWKFSK